MKFTATTLTFAGLTALVAALPQASETAEPSVTAGPTAVPTASVSIDPVYSSVLSCIAGCNPGDVYCQAQCQGLPTPDETAVNATHDCVAACPPGGDDAKNAAWAACQQKCVTELYWTASVPYTFLPTGDASATGGNTDATPTGTDGAEETGASESGDATGSDSMGDASATTTGPAPSETTNAASSILVNMPLLGAFGLFLGALAL